MAISFIGASSGADAAGGSWTANVHASSAIDDLLILCARTNWVGTNALPTEFTALHSLGISNNFIVGYRIKQSGDTTYTSSGNGANNMTWTVLTYRGIDTSSPFIVTDAQINAGLSGTTITTPTVNNTDSSAWWVTFAGDADVADSTKSSTSVSAGVERADVDTTTSADNPHHVGHDSNGTIATGNTSVVVTLDYTPAATTAGGASFIGIIKPAVTASTNVNQRMMTGIG